MEGDRMFYIYERSSGETVMHHADCEFSKRGKGIHPGDNHDCWNGPFLVEKALRYGPRYDQKSRWCRVQCQQAVARYVELRAKPRN